MTASAVRQGKGQFINGSWGSQGTIPLASINPATGKPFWQGSEASLQDVEVAYAGAREALKSWANTSFDERAALLQRFSQTVEAQRNQLARLISEEVGKPLWESLTEVNAVIAKINISIAAYKERTWPKSFEGAEAQSHIRYKPQGVVAVLGAFNFPAHLSNGHIVPALLAGNTVLYKPSEQAPAVAELIMECWQQSGLPAGVIQCLQGGSETGKAMLAQDIQGVYFTGSYQTGVRIHRQFADKPEVILALEMGGNNPLVIDSVAQMPATIYNTILSTLITSGQRCTCARRVLIPDNAYGDLFLQQFIKACEQVVIGAFDAAKEPFMGPVISARQADHLLATQHQLLEMGGTSLLAMTSMKGNTGLLTPGIIDMTKVQTPPDDEAFGPLIQIHRYSDFDEAIALANQTRYGLAAGLFSDDPSRYETFYHEVRAGLINWNRPTTGAASNLPFGGVGYSGNHRPSAYFAADYCAYPIASMEQHPMSAPATLLPGIQMDKSR